MFITLTVVSDTGRKTTRRINTDMIVEYYPTPAGDEPKTQVMLKVGDVVTARYVMEAVDEVDRMLMSSRDRYASQVFQ